MVLGFSPWGFLPMLSGDQSPNQFYSQAGMNPTPGAYSQSPFGEISPYYNPVPYEGLFGDYLAPFQEQLQSYMPGGSNFMDPIGRGGEDATTQQGMASPMRFSAAANQMVPADTMGMLRMGQNPSGLSEDQIIRIQRSQNAGIDPFTGRNFGPNLGYSPY